MPAPSHVQGAAESQAAKEGTEEPSLRLYSRNAGSASKLLQRQRSRIALLSLVVAGVGLVFLLSRCADFILETRRVHRVGSRGRNNGVRRLAEGDKECRGAKGGEKADEEKSLESPAGPSLPSPHSEASLPPGDRPPEPLLQSDFSLFLTRSFWSNTPEATQQGIPWPTEHSLVLPVEMPWMSGGLSSAEASLLRDPSSSDEAPGEASDDLSLRVLERELMHVVSAGEEGASSSGADFRAGEGTREFGKAAEEVATPEVEAASPLDFPFAGEEALQGPVERAPSLHSDVSDLLLENLGVVVELADHGLLPSGRHHVALRYIHQLTQRITQLVLAYSAFVVASGSSLQGPLDCEHQRVLLESCLVRTECFRERMQRWPLSLPFYELFLHPLYQRVMEETLRLTTALQAATALSPVSTGDAEVASREGRRKAGPLPGGGTTDEGLAQQARFQLEAAIRHLRAENRASRWHLRMHHEVRERGWHMLAMQSYRTHGAVVVEPLPRLPPGVRSSSPRGPYSMPLIVYQAKQLCNTFVATAGGFAASFRIFRDALATAPTGKANLSPLLACRVHSMFLAILEGLREEVQVYAKFVPLVTMPPFAAAAAHALTNVFLVAEQVDAILQRNVFGPQQGNLATASGVRQWSRRGEGAGQERAREEAGAEAGAPPAAPSLARAVQSLFDSVQRGHFQVLVDPRGQGSQVGFALVFLTELERRLLLLNHVLGRLPSSRRDVWSAAENVIRLLQTRRQSLDITVHLLAEMQSDVGEQTARRLWEHMKRLWARVSFQRIVEYLNDEVEGRLVLAGGASSAAGRDSGVASSSPQSEEGTAGASASLFQTLRLPLQTRPLTNSELRLHARDFFRQAHGGGAEGPSQEEEGEEEAEEAEQAVLSRWLWLRNEILRFFAPQDDAS